MTKETFFFALEKILCESPKFKNRILRGIDFDYIDSWLKAGISADAILEGILRTLKKFRPTAQVPFIKSIAYFRDEVIHAEKRRREWNR